MTDEFSKTCLALRAGRSFKAKDVIDVLENLMVVYGPPNHVRSDNGPEFVARAIQAFLAAAGVQTMFIQPGAPWQNPFAESFHARLRDELLDPESFQSVREAQAVLDGWRRWFNEERPDGALGDATPIVVLNRTASGTLAPVPRPLVEQQAGSSQAPGVRDGWGRVARLDARRSRLRASGRSPLRQTPGVGRSDEVV